MNINRYIRVGDIIKKRDSDSTHLYVVVDYVNNNTGNYGACCNNEVFTLVSIENMESHLTGTPSNESSTLIEFEKLKSLGIKIHHTRTYSFEREYEIVDTVPPFDIKVVPFAMIRRKTPKVTTVTKWV